MRAHFHSSVSGVGRDQFARLHKQLNIQYLCLVSCAGIADNLLHLLPLECVSDGQGSTSKRVRYLNNLAKVSEHIELWCVGHAINFVSEKLNCFCHC